MARDASLVVEVVAILSFCLSWIAVGLRVHVRKFMLKSFGTDDHVMLAALALFTAYLICQLGGVAHGTGKLRSQITDANAQTALQYWFLCEVFYTLSTSVTKISIGLFLLRIAVDRSHVWILRIITLGSGVVGTIYCLVVIVQCRPVSFWWDLDPTHKGVCLSGEIMVCTTYAVSALGSCADWIFAILPILIVKNLQMKKYTKIVVATILGLGAVASAATIIRMPYLHTAKQLKGEFLYKTVDIAIWSTVEVGLGITAGSIATLRPLLRRILATAKVMPTETHAFGKKLKASSGKRHEGSKDDNEPTRGLVSARNRDAFGLSANTTTTVISGPVSRKASVDNGKLAWKSELELVSVMSQAKIDIYKSVEFTSVVEASHDHDQDDMNSVKALEFEMKSH